MIKRYRIRRLKLKIVRYQTLVAAMERHIDTFESVPASYIRDIDERTATLGVLERKLEMLEGES